jgi:hypothetical protein
MAVRFANLLSMSPTYVKPHKAKMWRWSMLLTTSEVLASIAYRLSPKARVVAVADARPSYRYQPPLNFQIQRRRTPPPLSPRHSSLHSSETEGNDVPIAAQ